MDDLYNKYKPTNFDEMLVTSPAVKTFRKMAKNGSFPKAMLLSGPAGTGKSLVGSILPFALNCQAKTGHKPCMVCENCKLILENPNAAYQIFNMSSSRGIDIIRDIAPMLEEQDIYRLKKVFILEEAERITKDAQKAFKEPLSRLNSNTYVVMTTNDDTGFIDEILDRCQKYTFKGLTLPEAITLVTSVAKSEGIALTTAETNNIISLSDGRRPRNLLQTLQSFRDQGGIENANVDPADTSNSIGRILNMLVYRDSSRVNMTDIREDLHNVLEDADAIAIKNIICGTMRNLMLQDAKLQKLNPALRTDTVSFRYDIISKYMIPDLVFQSKDADFIHRMYRICRDIRQYATKKEPT